MARSVTPSLQNSSGNARVEKMHANVSKMLGNPLVKKKNRALARH